MVDRLRRLARRGWCAGYARLPLTPPAGWPLGRTVTGLVAAERLVEAPAVRALALAAGGEVWLLLQLDAALLCAATAAAIRAAVAAQGLVATVVADGGRSLPPLSAAADEGVYRRQVSAVCAAAAALAVGRAGPARVTLGGSPLEPADDSPAAAPALLPYLDLLDIAAAPGRPRIVVAVASLPRLVDPFRGELRRGVWGVAERAAAAVCGEPVALLGLPVTGVQEGDGRWQRTAREALLGARLGAAVAGALAGPREPLAPTLTVAEAAWEVPTLPLPDRYDIRRAADQAEFGVEDGTPTQRVERTARWRWLERLYAAAMTGRTAPVTVPTVRVTLGSTVLWGLGVDLSEPLAARLLETADAATTVLVSGANGRAGALLAQPERATLRGSRELEPLTDLWPLAPAAVTRLAESLAAPTAA